MKLILLLPLFLVLAACGNKAIVPTLPDPVPDQEMNTTEKGLSLMLDEDTFIGSPLVIETLVRNDSPHDFNYGEFYHIEVDVDGEWYIITYSDAVFFKNPRFIDFGIVLPAGNEARQTFSVEALGVTLLPADYRLVKTFLSRGEPMNEVSVAVPFWVK